MLHLASIRAMIPWCFSYDRMTYARYLPYYYTQVSQLQTIIIIIKIIHPDVHTKFIEGSLSFQLDSTNPFGRIPVDQTIEETMNKDTQTAGGTKGFSLKPGAVSTEEYFRQLRDRICQGKSKFSHQDLQGPRINRDEDEVQFLFDLMENNWLSPMSPDEIYLVNLFTGTVAQPDVARNLLRALDIGEETCQVFKQTRLDEC